MGVVFEAHDESLDRQVAIKIISPHLADDPAFRERFIREARSLASLDSAHVVHVYAHGEATEEEGGRLYLVTQLIPDGDLGSLLQAYGAPPPAMAVDLIAQVADGLADAHAAGLIHRDIKPANVLLRRRPDGNQAYLSDFGIARQVEADPSGTTTGSMGTPTYMAPELHLGHPPGVTSDVYSLGCLLWAALTGRAPYAGTSDYQVVTAHLEQPVPQLDPTSDFAVEANRILRRSMAKTPADRYPTAAALRDDLRRALTLSTEPPTPNGEPTLVQRRVRRSVNGALAGVVAGIGLVVLIVVVSLLTGDDDDPSADPPRQPGSSSPQSPSSSEALPSSDAPSGPDEEKAIASFASALEGQGGLTKKQSACVAREVVQKIGLETLVADGFFDEDLNFTDQDLGGHPDVKNALTNATLTCLT